MDNTSLLALESLLLSWDMLDNKLYPIPMMLTMYIFLIPENQKVQREETNVCVHVLNIKIYVIFFLSPSSQIPFSECYQVPTRNIPTWKPSVSSFCSCLDLSIFLVLSNNTYI